MLHRQIEQQIASVRGNRVFLAQPLGRAPRDVGTTSIAVPVGSRVGRVRQVSVGFDQERNVPTAWPNSVAGALGQALGCEDWLCAARPSAGRFGTKSVWLYFDFS